MTNDRYKYLQVANRIERMIETGTLHIGDKLLSVRALSKEQGISLSTAFQAYYHLESKGLVEARPKSGYYVTFSPAMLPEQPGTFMPKEEVRSVSVADMISTVYRDIVSDDIVKLSIGMPSPELLPVAKLNKAVSHVIRNYPHHCLHYEAIQGNAVLRRQVARMAFNWGGVLSEEEVIITAGCMEAVSFCLKAVTRPGDTVAIESPTYFGIFQIVEALGLKILETPTHPKSGVDLSYLERAIPQYNIKACLFVTNFSNPLSSLMPEANKERLVQLINKYDIPLIENDIYGELYFGKTRPRTCKSFDTRGNVLLCSSVSKTLAPGYRIGWAIPGKYQEEVMRVKMYQNIATSTLTQAAVGHFLEKGRYELHMRNLRKALHTQCLRYIQCIIEHFPASTKLTRPQGGFVLWLELDTRINAFELYQRALRHHISIAPGQIFSVHGHYQNCIRLSYGRIFDEKVENSIRTLGTLIHELAY